MRRLLVLGGSSGIGKASADLLREIELFEKIEAYGKEDFDVRDRTDLRRVIRNLHPTDVIYSVGINILDWMSSVSLRDFSAVMGANVYGFINAIRLLDEDEDVQGCNIVAVTSDAAWRPMRTSSVYCASKAALEMVVRVASREYAPRGWRINAVAPGKVEDTPMTDYVDYRVPQLRGWTPEFAEEYERSSSPLGRKIGKKEVAQVIAQVLLGPAAQTGEIVAVNGGR